MRRRTRDSMAMGENDLLLLRYLLKARSEDRLVSPGELAKYLSVTTASMTAMIDRLERSGHVRRQPHATDRRSIWIIPTDDADDEVRRTLGTMHERMLDAVIDMTPEENRVVVATLARLRTAVDHIEPGDFDALGEHTPDAG